MGSSLSHAFLPEGYQLEVAVFGWHVDHVSGFNERLGPQTVGYQILDTDDADIVLFGHDV